MKEICDCATLVQLHKFQKNQIEFLWYAKFGWLLTDLLQILSDITDSVRITKLQFKSKIREHNVDLDPGV